LRTVVCRRCTLGFLPIVVRPGEPRFETPSRDYIASAPVHPHDTIGKGTDVPETTC